MKRRRVERILVMDDEEQVRLLAGTLLAFLGYEVILARDGREAVDFYAAAVELGEPFGAVLLDLCAPDGLGALPVMRALSEFDPRVKAILTTGLVDHPAFREYWKHGFCGAVPKPFSIRGLAAALGRLFEGCVEQPPARDATAAAAARLAAPA